MAAVSYRREIYSRLRDVFLSHGVSHVGLWNEQVAFIEQEAAWPRPAVFVEFGGVLWRYPDKSCVDGLRHRRGVLPVVLHIVSDVVGDDVVLLDVYDLCETLCQALTSLSGVSFRRLKLVESRSDHNHEELLETIEVYECDVLTGC